MIANSSIFRSLFHHPFHLTISLSHVKLSILILSPTLILSPQNYHSHISKTCFVAPQNLPTPQQLSEKAFAIIGVLSFDYATYPAITKVMRNCAAGYRLVWEIVGDVWRRWRDPKPVSIAERHGLKSEKAPRTVKTKVRRSCQSAEDPKLKQDGARKSAGKKLQEQKGIPTSAAPLSSADPDAVVHNPCLTTVSKAQSQDMTALSAITRAPKRQTEIDPPNPKRGKIEYKCRIPAPKKVYCLSRARVAYRGSRRQSYYSKRHIWKRDKAHVTGTQSVTGSLPICTVKQIQF